MQFKAAVIVSNAIRSDISLSAGKIVTSAAHLNPR